MDTVFEVLKWVLIVLIAGFIGQFGRTLSHYLIDYFKKRKEKGIAMSSPETSKVKRASTEPQEISVVKKDIILPSKEEEEKHRSKTEKKDLKAQLKAKKKSEKSKEKG
jgi:hypothetical protein